MAIQKLFELWRQTIAGDTMIPSSFGKRNRRAFRTTQLRCRCNQRIEHLLQIECRAADNLENVGCGRLLLQRLSEFVEQPRVLDGDDGLGREVLDEFDLLVSEGT